MTKKQETMPEPEVINENGEPVAAAIATRPMAPMTVDVQDASAHGLALMRERVKNQTEMLKVAVRLTAPNQWTVFAGTGSDGVYRESVYPTGGAADTILRRAFGLTWGEKTISVEDTPDGKLATCSAWLMQNGQPLEHFTGYRLMGGYIKTEADLRRAVVENLKSVAVRDLLGLRFRSADELREFGLDVGKLERRAEFQSHSKQSGEVVAPFGRHKGKPLSELPDDDLKWLGKAIGESVSDPSKSKWKDKNAAMHKACQEEWARRHPKAAETEEPASDDQGEFDYGPPPMDDDEHADAF